ncbi:hypothetical protein KZ773_12910 [Escherichia coli]|nr:hypothetical protein [Escherichia coli]
MTGTGSNSFTIPAMMIGTEQKNSDQNGQYDTQQKGYRSEYSRHNEFIQKVSHRQCAKEAQGADFSRKRPK